MENDNMLQEGYLCAVQEQQYPHALCARSLARASCLTQLKDEGNERILFQGLWWKPPRGQAPSAYT